MLTVVEKKFYCLGLDSYDNHRGIEVGEWWGDEVAYNKVEAFDVMAGRLRDPNGKLDVLFTTTPKGHNWLFDYFHIDGEKHDSKVYSLIKAPTSKNIYLPDGYEDLLRSQYDDLVSKQELEGEFVNISSGRIYYAFDRENHVRPMTWDRRFPLHAGVDFNVNPMTASIGQIIGDRLHVIDEFYLKDSNTPALAAALKSKYGTNITLWPDSTGVKRTTNANTSDIKILKSFGFNVKSVPNPFRIDRYAAVNGAFANGRVALAPHCKQLIKDLESVVYAPGTDRPDTSDKMLTHSSDNLGYMIFNTINPLRNNSIKVVSQLR